MPKYMDTNINLMHIHYIIYTLTYAYTYLIKLNESKRKIKTPTVPSSLYPTRPSSLDSYKVDFFCLFLIKS